MAIPITRYVDITSGVGAGSVVRLRDLIARVFTTNPLLPTGAISEFTSAAAVGDYFGTSSDEYLRSVFYFGWISKLITKPSKISFSRWADEATAPLIYGGVHTQSVSAWTGISNGAFVLSLAGTSHTISGMDFTAATTLAGIAAIIQTKIRLQSGSMWTAATVTYNSTRGSFDFVGGATGAAAIAVSAPGSGTNILGDTLLGWTASAIFSNGAAIQTALETVTASAEANDNFGSFAFIDSLSLSDVTAVAAWNHTQNVKYMYSVPVLLADAASYYAALKDYSGVAITEVLTSGEYPEFAPMMILAATDYSRQNSVSNYMFNQFALTPSVTTSAKADTLDAYRCNYYGQTQSAGQLLSFYQRGILMGDATAPVDMNVYANEMWFKNSAAASMMTLLLALSQVSANAQGRTEVLTILQDTIDQAIANGTISQGKTLTTTQKLYINNVTGSTTAWYQVQSIGYWVDCQIQSYTTVDSRTEYKAVYIVVYSKDDAIRKIEGTHTLI